MSSPGHISERGFGETRTALDGLTIQLALGDPGIDEARAFELTMRLLSGQLGFSWTPARTVDA